MNTFISLCSQLIGRYCEIFSNKRILFSGDIEDLVPIKINTLKTKIHTQKYHFWKKCAHLLKKDIEYSVCATFNIVNDCNTLVYYWPKNKLEAVFHLTNLMSLFPKGSNIFVVGEKKNGINSIKNIMRPWARLSKIKNANHCKLYFGILEKNSHFNIGDFWKKFFIENIFIKSLPGVFGRNKLDYASKLLISTFNAEIIQGNMLDVGCGTGVLSLLLGKRYPNLKLCLIDNHAAAIQSAKKTLESNFFSANIFPSDIYSNVDSKFNIIISNPSFHFGRKVSFQVAKNIIFHSVKYLKYNGELRIVGNTWLPYGTFLKNVFGQYDILAHEKNFKVYRAKMY